MFISEAAARSIVQEIKEVSERDNWMTAQEALDFGLIDMIITNKR